MTWERQLLDLFDDLEQRAEGLALVQRDAEVAELARAGYAEVDLASRLHASIGHTVELTVAEVGAVRGRLAGVGAGWCLVVPDGAGGGQEWAVVTGALTSVRGLAAAAHTEPVRPVTSRLGIGSLLRRVAEEREKVVLVRVGGERRSGMLGRVGADFLELVTLDGGIEAVPFSAVVAFRRG